MYVGVAFTYVSYVLRVLVLFGCAGSSVVVGVFDMYSGFVRGVGTHDGGLVMVTLVLCVSVFVYMCVFLLFRVYVVVCVDGRCVGGYGGGAGGIGVAVVFDRVVVGSCFHCCCR